MPLYKVSKKALKKPVPEPILVAEKEIFNEVELNKNKRIKNQKRLYQNISLNMNFSLYSIKISIIRL